MFDPSLHKCYTAKSIVVYSFIMIIVKTSKQLTNLLSKVKGAVLDELNPFTFRPHDNTHYS